MDDKTSLTQLTALVQEELARLRSRAGALPGRQNAGAPLPEIAEASERARLRALRSALRVAATLLDQPDPAGVDAMKAELAALENELQAWRSSSRSWTEERYVRRKKVLVERGADGQETTREVEQVYGPYLYVRWRDERGKLHSRCLGRADDQPTKHEREGAGPAGKVPDAPDASAPGAPGQRQQVESDNGHEAIAHRRPELTAPHLAGPAETRWSARPTSARGPERGPTVGVLLSYITAGQTYSSGVLRGIQSVLRAQQGELIAFQEFTPRRIVESGVGRRRVDGWIVALETEGLEELAADATPLVTIAAADPHCPSVMIDNRGGVRTLVHHLVDHGHRRIAFVGCAQGVADLRQRFEGYRAALEERGIAYDPTLLYEVRANGQREGREGGRRIVEDGVPCTAVVAGTDWNALGVIEALVDAGYRVPEDVAVVGFDNIDFGPHDTPSLTTVRQSFEAIGATAAQLLIARLGGAYVTAGVTYVPVEPVLRRSCGCLEEDELQHAGPAGAAAVLRRYRAREIARHRALDELRDSSYNSYRITFPLLERGTSEIMNLDWLSQSKATWGCLGLWRSGADEEAPQEQGRLSARQDDHAQTNGHEPVASTIVVTGSYLRTAETSEARAHQLACAPGDFPPRALLPQAAAAADDVIKVFRIKTYTQPDEWGFLAIRGSLETYHEHIGMWAHMIGSVFEREALVASLTSAKQAAEQANRLKTQFLSNVSHELRTPLNAIIGFADLLRQEGAGDTLPHLRQRILANAAHLRDMIGDILDLAKIEAGRLELRLQETELRPLLQSVMATASGLTRDRPIELRLELPPDLPEVLVDPLRIRQVLLNLLSNAAKFTPRGSITVRVERHELPPASGVGASPSVERSRRDVSEGDAITSGAPLGTRLDARAAYLLVAVEDTGIGIAAEHQQLVFEEFRQIQGAHNREYEGSGLGLPICRRLIELHGGRLWLESEPGVGTTFFFSLPLEPALAAQPLPAVDAPARATIVLVDDESPEQQTLSGYLERQGYEVALLRPQAATADQVVALQPRLIIVNTQHHGVDGWAVIDGLHNHPATRETPVLAMPLLQQQTLSLALGANDYLVKPVQTEEVLGAVERWVAPAGATILVVDDYADAREIMRVRLAAAGHRVLEAANGLEALAVIRERHPDLVLLDLMMPRMDGFEVLQRLREDPAISATPVIVLTAQVLSEAELARLNRSVTTVLEKGVFRAEEVLSQVGAVLAGQHKLGGPTQRVVRAAMAYIHEHYGERLTREAIAAQVAVGARHLTRAFQQELGMSPMTYLMRYRVHQARRLLAAQYMSVAEVAEAVGFSNEFHFNRLFRREVGVSPGAYRRGARSEG